MRFIIAMGFTADVDLARVAEEFETPLYVYSARTILDHYSRLDAALTSLNHLICYAVKANSNRAILNCCRAGASSTSFPGRAFRALKAAATRKNAFAGGKIARGNQYALDQNVCSFNVESERTGIHR
jgi:diaminopimelate decarboxylase